MIARGRAGESKKVGSGRPTTANRRRVNWFVPNGGVARSVSGLNNSAWAEKHRSALTGYFPCCSCWAALPNGTFSSNGGRCGPWAAERALGLDIVPTGSFSVDWILGEAWTQPGALASAVALVEREGWSGLGVDNENFSAQKDWDPRLPARFASLLGNLSAALDAAGKQLVVDVCSTWNGCVCGGAQNLAEYARRAPAARFMDMADYFQKGNIPGGDAQQVLNLKKVVPVGQIAAGVGLVDASGHKNASCGGWPQCTNFSDPACGCLWYGWNASTLSAFVDAAEAAGVEEIDVWRQDMTPPPGTSADVPEWFIDTMAGFLQRGEAATDGQSWHLQSVRALDAPAGRYTQTRVAASDGNATLVWNGNAPRAGLRLTRCLDPACARFAPPVTLAHADPNPRFVRMELGGAGAAAGSLPRIVFAGENDTKLFFLRCANADCSDASSTSAKELAAADRVRYFDLLVDDGNDARGGCGADAFAVALSFDKEGDGVGEGSWLNVVYGYPGDPGCPGGEVCEIAHSPQPFTIDPKTNLPSAGLDNPVLARTASNGLTLAFWDIGARALRLVFTPPGVPCGDGEAGGGARTVVTVASNATGGFTNPGAWTRMVAVNGGAHLIIAFFDLPAGTLYVAACDAERHTCETPRAVDTAAGHRDFTDYGAGAFPDLRIAPDGNPLLVYFSEAGGGDDGTAAGQLKAMVCADPLCAAFRVEVLASGAPGYGRDCSVAFDAAGERMLVSFLDLQGKDTPGAMVARLGVWEAR